MRDVIQKQGASFFDDIAKGAGLLKTQTEEALAELATWGMVTSDSFTGLRADMREIYASSDVVLSLSRQPESFGRSVLEAISLGVPVVGGDHGGVGEVLARVFPQGLVPVGDIGAATRRVSEFLAERPDVPALRTYSLREMLAATLDVYEKLCLR